MSTPFIAEIVGFGGNFAPRGWAFCEGQLLSINSNQALFSLLGTTYGGDGRVTFALPDLRGRAAIQQGTGPGLSNYRLGQRGGTETNTMTVQQMPSHNHLMNVRQEDGNKRNPNNDIISAIVSTQATDIKGFSTQTADGTLQADAIRNTGGNQAQNNLHPYLAINWIIALVGTFPSRS